MSATRGIRVLVMLLLAGCLATPALAASLLRLKDGREFQVTRMERRGDQVVFQTVDGKVFQVAADTVASPPLDEIPAAGTAPAAAAPAATPGRIVLKDGRSFDVLRAERRGDQVVFQTTAGAVFTVPAASVVSPPLDQIPAAGAAPPSSAGIIRLKDGRTYPATRMERRDGTVVFQTVHGDVFQVPADQVVSPPLESIPAAGGAPTPAPPTPEPTPGLPVLPTRPAPPAPPPYTGPAVPDFAPIPDRWAIAYPVVPGRSVPVGRHLDPYNQNVFKGDKPVVGDDVFLVVTGVLETPTEVRRLPIGSGVSTLRPDSREFFGNFGQVFTTPRALLSAELFQGDTAFKPKTWAVKAEAALNMNHLRLNENNGVNIDVREGRTRTRWDFALQEAFAEVKLADLSPYYDAVSVRAGIQPFVSDFRGFVFSDTNLGARLFGNLANNRWQYNAAYFDLLEKETNSELNTFAKRNQKVIVANLFKQDFLAKGFTLELSYHRNQDQADRKPHYDENDFLVRPANIGQPRLHQVKTNYVGLATDGHLGRLNLTEAAYYAFGVDEDNPLADGRVDVRAMMGALELSVDRDWARFKASGFFASGDDNAYDSRATGFDVIDDLPNFAGGPFSFWNRSGIALTQTGVLLKAPGSLVPDLRSNKFEGQANHVNPGVIIVGLGADLDLTPKLRAVLNANYIRFHRTGALETLLFQPDIHKDVGFDLGGGVLYRPLLSENIVITAGVTGLLSGKGFDDIYSSTCGSPGCGSPGRNLMNAFVNVKLTY